MPILNTWLAACRAHGETIPDAACMEAISQTVTTRSDRLAWIRDGADWPNREASNFVRSEGLVWHVQRMGQGPVLLLLHGTGASTHSWRSLMPLLATHFTVVAPDLPGHGFSDSLPGGMSLPAMARALSSLLAAMNVAPALAAGHSAGAAILLRMQLDAGLHTQGLVSLNGALLAPAGMAALLFAPAAKVFAGSYLLPKLFAWAANDDAALKRLVASTGSQLDPRGIELYGRLVRNPAHVRGALDMMAGWDLRSLERDLPLLRVPLRLIVGANDRTIAPGQALRVQGLLPAATITGLAGLGHLAHEEQPEAVAALIEQAARELAVLPAGPR